MAVAHYLEALKWQKEIIKIHTVFGGKNPHPNYLVGGMASAISMQGDNAINMERLNMVKGLIQDAIQVVENMYIPDLLAVASFYPEWTQIRRRAGQLHGLRRHPAERDRRRQPSSASRAASS